MDRFLFLAQDWQDIDFALENMVDFIAISFVKSADVIENLSHYIERRTGSKKSIEVFAFVRTWGCDIFAIFNCSIFIQKLSIFFLSVLDHCEDRECGFTSKP